ncbi:hypothetical protein FB45DRAFT_217203 [Roridomyces roridus]|uniref:Uncharacterized protein n=1 Tax=Roridomyces roridus TaxID=1738132 RepID=A0AAD7BDY2_9AGAR|nr:hypothetical protein FB45DRAFT_217203 [Roridomyces roridus]
MSTHPSNFTRYASCTRAHNELATFPPAHLSRRVHVSSSRPTRHPSSKTAALRHCSGTRGETSASHRSSPARVLLQRYDSWLIAYRIFLLERKRVEGELKEVFKVVGSTGNTYTFTIQSKPSCDCISSLTCPISI